MFILSVYGLNCLAYTLMITKLWKILHKIVKLFITLTTVDIFRCYKIGFHLFQIGKKFKTLINMSLNMIEIKIMSYGRVKIFLHINMQNWKFQQKLLVLQFWLASHWYVGILRQIRESFERLNFHYYFCEILILTVTCMKFWCFE